MKRSFSTRELAQMWNVSESTVKRWADHRELGCHRTPGGHRRFTLRDIHEFQSREGFEANGLLEVDTWSQPDLEELLNRKDFEEVRERFFYLASQNQRVQIRELAMRLLLRGVPLEDILDEVIGPLLNRALAAASRGELSSGQVALLRKNVEEALYFLYPQIGHKKGNGKTALCASPEPHSGLLVSSISKLFEIEGWESLNLGDSVEFSTMTEMVKSEPINLVCIVSSQLPEPIAWQESISGLLRITGEYRIPLLFFSPAAPFSPDLSEIEPVCFEKAAALRSHVSFLTRETAGI